MSLISKGKKAFGSISGANALKKGARQAKKIGKLNAAAIQEETSEQIRRLELTHNQIKGTATALIGKSGIGFEGSNQNYLNELETQFQSEKDWMNKSSLSRQEIAKMGAKSQAMSLKSQAKSANIGLATTAAQFVPYGSIASGATSFFKKDTT